MDTFSVHHAQHNSLNAVIYLAYDFSDKWGIGFNIEAAGITFDGSREGKMISSNRPSTSPETVVAKPTPYHLLLISDNDIGMLNSDLYVTYTINKRLSVNAGLTFLFSEYTTAEKISYNDDNDRFRYKSLMGMLSINFKPFYN
jgi:long-subunit fatty acid transport protein